jgi:hypothetical protein
MNLNPFEPIRKQIKSLGQNARDARQDLNFLREALGRIELRQCAQLASTDLRDYEFKVYSQWGEDGIIQFLLRHVPIERRIFVEFGVESYVEANTRFLLVNDNWSGLVLDGNEQNIAAIRRDPIYWQRNLKAVQAFVTRENINDLLASNGVTGEVGILSVDIDGNDYWVWEAITVVQPAIVILEYNGRFSPDRSVTVPYDPAFQRSKAHHSHIYYGASLAALTKLSASKGYALVGSNSIGSNAFYIRRDLLRAPLREISPAEAWTRPQFRETRDQTGALTFASTQEEDAILATLPLVNV